MKISTTYNIIDEIRKQGYSKITCEDLEISQYLQESKERLIENWNNLPIDEHLKTKKAFRERRYGRYFLNSRTQELKYHDKKIDYKIAKASYNQLYNNQIRVFEQLTKTTSQNNFLKKLILFDFHQLPTNDKSKSVNWNVGIHQIRIKALDINSGLPTPEGIHKDGEMFTVQHLINRINVKGGENFIYNNDKNIICSWTQQNQFDSYYFEDDAIWHSVSPIHAQNKDLPAYRDILLIDFDPLNE